MLIEQIFEYKSREPGPLIVHIFLKLVIFMTIRNSKANLGANYLTQKMTQKAIYLASPDQGQAWPTRDTAPHVTLRRQFLRGLLLQFESNHIEYKFEVF